MTEKRENAKAEKRCFVICPIGDERSETRERSDQVLEFIIEPVAKAAGYTVKRADTLGQPGIITHQIIELLQSAELVVADLTGHNPNVMYELAIRHAVRRPLVQLIGSGERIPFDVASARTIAFDWRDMRSVDSCKRELATQIASVEKDPGRVDNPITAAIDLVALQRSGDTTEVLLGQVIEQLGNLGQRLTSLEQRALARADWQPYSPARRHPPEPAPGVFATLTSGNVSEHVTLGTPSSLDSDEIVIRPKSRTGE